MDSKQFGKNLHRLRMARRQTQNVFADRSGISRRYLQRLEAGRVSPTLRMMGRLISYLNCSWDELLGKRP